LISNVEVGGWNLRPAISMLKTSILQRASEVLRVPQISFKRPMSEVENNLKKQESCYLCSFPEMIFMLTYSEDTCIPMFKAKIWNQTTYPRTDEWTKKMWYVYTMKSEFTI
jgi:hypothetical protein